ncbi:MAG: oligosaccharide flippase family protein, partial [Thermoguttaceae bacterium]|nr:oligosaccharide flippase family protein [Thermoguttaceae bacterium]
MNAEQIQKKTVRASKWSALTELVVKLIQPISNLILVRILAPEAFAAVALINMVVSFADIFTDAGFQKYVVQRDYDSEDQKDLTVNVAFWTNLGISVFLWAIIAAFQAPIAAFVKAPDLALGIVVAALALPMTSFSSIQAALFRRDFNFKTLFYTRLFFALVPLAVTIPLALLGLNYWAIVIGTLCGRLFEAVFLTAL